MISVQVAVYPMGQQDFAAVDAAVAVLQASGLELQVGPMSSVISGPTHQVFEVLGRAFDAAAGHGGTVLQLTATNACPV